MITKKNLKDTSSFLDKTVPLGKFLDEQLARVNEIGNAETDEIIETEHFETPIRPSSHRYELPETITARRDAAA